MVGSGRNQPVVDIGGVLGGYVELPAELPEVGDAQGVDTGVTDLDLLRAQVGKVVVRQ